MHGTMQDKGTVGNLQLGGNEAEAGSILARGLVMFTLM